MTITPCNLGSDPNFSGGNYGKRGYYLALCDSWIYALFLGSAGSQQSAPIWAKSDHFTSAENLDNAGILRKNVSNPDYGDCNVTTSDESSEAMRIFAASPPEPQYLHKRFSDHYSSNESLGIQNKFRSRSNTNQSHKSDVDDSSAASNEVKIGAFATRKISDNAPSAAEAEDDFLDLFTLEADDQEKELSEKIDHLSIKPKPTTSASLATKSPAKRAILFQDEPEDNNTKPQSKKKSNTPFVLLNTPFSMANAEFGTNPEGDLGVFFKDVQAAPQLKSTVTERCDDMTDASLEATLTNLCDDLNLYENKSEEYEELLKCLEATATTSESESEAS